MAHMQAMEQYRNFEGINYPRPFRNAAGGGMAPAASEVLDPNDRTWTITVANAATSAKTCYLFGAIRDLTDTDLDENITITVSDSTHKKLKTELLTQPVRILGLKYTVTTASQFSYGLSLYDEKSTGSEEKRVWYPLNYRSAQNNLTTQIDAPSFELLLTPSVYIKFTILGSETVTFAFNIVEKAQLHNVLRNSPVVAVANRPAPTGLPQMDMPRGV